MENNLAKQNPYSAIETIPESNQVLVENSVENTKIEQTNIPSNISLEGEQHITNQSSNQSQLNNETHKQGSSEPGKFIDNIISFIARIMGKPNPKTGETSHTPVNKTMVNSEKIQKNNQSQPQEKNQNLPTNSATNSAEKILGEVGSLLGNIGNHLEKTTDTMIKKIQTPGQNNTNNKINNEISNTIHQEKINNTNEDIQLDPKVPKEDIISNNQ